MLEAAKRLIASSSLPVVPFVPRQIMLEKHYKESQAMEKKTIKKAEKEKKEKKHKRKEEVKLTLLNSIASYLERNGFSKTLSALQSEAQLEIDGCKASTLKLEEVILNILDSSDGLEKFGIEWCRDQGMKENGIIKRDEGETALDATHHIDEKKRRKGSRVVDEKVEDNESGKGVDTESKISEEPLNGLQVKSKGKKSKLFTPEDACAEIHKKQQEAKDLEVKTDPKKSNSDQERSKNKTSVEDALVEIKDKKKRKLVSDSAGETNQKIAIETVCGRANDGDHESQLPQSNVAGKEKKKKKHKVIDNHEKNSENSDPGIIQNVIKEKIKGSKSVTKNSDTLSVDSDVNYEGEKKGKRKENLDSVAERIEGNIDSVAKHAFTENPSEKLDSKRKDKKKKKEKTSSGDHHAMTSDQLNGGTFNDSKKENGTDHEVQVDLRKSEPRMQTDNIDGKVSKKRKRPSSEGTELAIDNAETVESKQSRSVGGKDDKETGIPQKANTSFVENGCNILSKRQKTEENKHNLADSSSKEILNSSLNKDDTVSQDSENKIGNELADADLVKNAKEGGISAKSTKKEKHSAEPKTAFQRVKIDEVKFADERLQDNSYWAKDGADIGYGAKAQEVLGQVRGRDFRHEKTKKKRGTYRGGLIDLQSHSVKFNYSDDE
ncbi:Srp40 C-terminal protein [Dioscorea alata]|uniref:Srp40 C-terminal protein n=1 Tax=Dioscorea alata TaxID=55571 RepID=A0ACB7VIE1_DIOAL|nr:Srp40 C-terminal protein [Dioscorea alata]